MGESHTASQRHQAGTYQGLSMDLESLFRSIDAPQQAEGMTSEELQTHFGRSERWLRPRLKRLIAEGRCEAMQVPQVDMAGRRNWTIRYRFKEVGA
jgi:hypothetical protein